MTSARLDPSHTIVHDPPTRKSTGTPWSNRLHSKVRAKEKLQTKGSFPEGSEGITLPSRREAHGIVTLE